MGGTIRSSSVVKVPNQNIGMQLSGNTGEGSALLRIVTPSVVVSAGTIVVVVLQGLMDQPFSDEVDALAVVIGDDAEPVSGKMLADVVSLIGRLETGLEAVKEEVVAPAPRMSLLLEAVFEAVNEGSVAPAPRASLLLRLEAESEAVDDRDVALSLRVSVLGIELEILEDGLVIMPPVPSSPVPEDWTLLLLVHTGTKLVEIGQKPVADWAVMVSVPAPRAATSSSIRIAVRSMMAC